MSPVYSVTHFPGLYPKRNLPFGWGTSVYKWQVPKGTCPTRLPYYFIIQLIYKYSWFDGHLVVADYDLAEDAGLAFESGHGMIIVQEIR